jgi:hypothetical protein
LGHAALGHDEFSVEAEHGKGDKRKGDAKESRYCT